MPDIYKLAASNIVPQPEHDYSDEGKQRLFGPLQATTSLWYANDLSKLLQARRS